MVVEAATKPRWFAERSEVSDTEQTSCRVAACSGGGRDGKCTARGDLRRKEEERERGGDYSFRDYFIDIGFKGPRTEVGPVVLFRLSPRIYIRFIAYKYRLLYLPLFSALCFPDSSPSLSSRFFHSILGIGLIVLKNLRCLSSFCYSIFASSTSSVLLRRYKNNSTKLELFLSYISFPLLYRSSRLCRFHSFRLSSLSLFFALSSLCQFCHFVFLSLKQTPLFLPSRNPISFHPDVLIAIFGARTIRDNFERRLHTFS